MYNYGNYIIRQEFISTSKEKEEGLRENANWIKYNELFKLCKESDPYRELGSNVGQATLRKLDKTWKSFFRIMVKIQVNIVADLKCQNILIRIKADMNVG